MTNGYQDFTKMKDNQRRMSHPAVRAAYEQFLTVARLCEETEKK